MIKHEVREFRKDDEIQVLELLNLVFKNRNITSDYWNWKYFDNPLKNQSIAVSEYKNQIIGVSCGFYRDVKVGDNTYLTQIGGDLAVHPDYRRMGISNDMTKVKEKIQIRDGVELFSGITTNPIISNNRNKKGYPRFPKKLLEMVYIEDERKEGFGLHKKLSYKAYKSVRKLVNNKSKRSVTSDLNEVNAFGKEADVFWEKIGDRYYLIFKRDSENLNWRYCDRRAGEYRVFVALDDGELIGYCVTLADYSRALGFIFDLSVLPESISVVEGLVEKAVHSLIKEVNMIKYLVVRGHPFVPFFSGLGFIPRASSIDFRVIDKYEYASSDLAKCFNSSSDRLSVQYGDTDLL
jgi:ribosomal protein S18 acetylase RimI-like enzyme